MHAVLSVSRRLAFGGLAPGMVPHGEMNEGAVHPQGPLPPALAPWPFNDGDGDVDVEHD